MKFRHFSHTLYPECPRVLWFWLNNFTIKRKQLTFGQYGAFELWQAELLTIKVNMPGLSGNRVCLLHHSQEFLCALPGKVSQKC